MSEEFEGRGRQDEVVKRMLFGRSFWLHHVGSLG